MKLLRNQDAPPNGILMEAMAACVAHRCIPHREIPPLNMNEGNGSSECGVCAAEEFGAALAEKAIDILKDDWLYPVLDGYADRLDYGARMRRILIRARNRLNLAAPGSGDFIDRFLDGGDDGSTGSTDEGV